MSSRLKHAQWGKIGLVTIVVLYILWSLAPVVIAFLFSFNAGYSRSTWQGFSTAVVDRAEVSVQPADLHRCDPPQPACWLCSPWSSPCRWACRSRSSSAAGAASRGTGDLPGTVPLVVPELVLALALFFLVTKLNLPIISLGTSGQASARSHSSCRWSS